MFTLQIPLFYVIVAYIIISVIGDNFANDPGANIKITVWDEDKFIKDTLIGQVNIPVNSLSDGKVHEQVFLFLSPLSALRSPSNYFILFYSGILYFQQRQRYMLVVTFTCVLITIQKQKLCLLEVPSSPPLSPSPLYLFIIIY
jgi:hypothetical protein